MYCVYVYIYTQYDDLFMYLLIGADEAAPRPARGTTWLP